MPPSLSMKMTDMSTPRSDTTMPIDPLGYYDAD